MCRGWVAAAAFVAGFFGACPGAAVASVSASAMAQASNFGMWAVRASVMGSSIHAMLL
jgi:hypothetical protein